ncbi:hypothetical protein RRSWK_05884 [Rhodopirellula sp. SWK7]|nr:hypothetical protein RRSWK_05884 [Rhodopirellula sp. SWK7]
MDGKWRTDSRAFMRLYRNNPGLYQFHLTVVQSNACPVRQKISGVLSRWTD